MNAGPTGLLALDKPAGPTSHDLVARVRRVLGTRRVGHAGTLDPFATGLLLVLVGPATRLAEYFSGMDKSYVTELRLGVVTDTDDRTGREVETSDGWTELTRADVERAASQLVGPILQMPPAYSAKRVDGERMYRKARRGEQVEAKPVEVTVRSLEVLSFEPPLVRFSVRCSSGTYVRALGRDLGAALGVGGHLTELRRTAIGDFDVGRAAGMDGLESEGADLLIDPVSVLTHLPRIEVSADEEMLLTHGRFVALGESDGGAGPESEVEAESDPEADPEVEPQAEVEPGPTLALRDGRLVAVGFVKDGSFRPRKVFKESGS